MFSFSSDGATVGSVLAKPVYVCGRHMLVLQPASQKCDSVSPVQLYIFLPPFVLLMVVIRLMLI